MFQNPYGKYDMQKNVQCSMFKRKNCFIRNGIYCLLSEMFRVAYCSRKSQKGTSDHDEEMLPDFRSNFSPETMDLLKTKISPLKS